MTLTDNELCMLEQLCYLNNKIADAAGVSGFSGVKGGQRGLTIGKILESFDDAALDRLSSPANNDLEWSSGKRWADIIRYLKNSQLSGLVLSETMIGSDGTTLAMCFSDSNEPNNAIVAFKGTSGSDEWSDNVEGLNKADTKCQKEALDFIEGLPYGDIIVTGHSKGGNKAMYVAITSDKISRCVAYDGQGFSQEFIDKYWAEIQERGGNVTCYSLSTDYVHILLFPIPNSNQKFCAGYGSSGEGVDNIGQHHSSVSFFVTNENGNIVFDENGNPIVVEVDEDESIALLHNFTTFVLNNADDTDKVEIVGFLAPLLGIVFDDKKSNQDRIDFILEHPDELAIVIAYLAKYMDEYNFGTDEIDKLLDVLGLNSLNELLTITSFEVFGQHVDVNLNLVNIINAIKKQLNDNDDDYFIKHVVLPVLKFIFAKDYDIDVTDFWTKINTKVKNINVIGDCSNATAKVGAIRDFSIRVYDILIDSASRLESVSSDSVSTWNSYSGEDWYSTIFVDAAIKGFSAYFKKISDVSTESKKRINTVFSNVSGIDRAAGKKISGYNQLLQRICSNLKECVT